MDRRFAFFVVSFSVTLLLLQSISGFWPAVGISAAVTAGFSVLLFIKSRSAQAAFLTSGFVFAILLFLIYPKIDTVPELYKDDMEFEGTVTRYSYENNKKTGVACDIEISSLNGEELEDSFKTKMFFKDKNLEFTPGDVICGLATFEVPENDEDFNSYTYYKARGFDTIAFCNKKLYSHVENEVPVRFIPQMIAHEINTKISELLPERLAGFVSAVLIGDKTDFNSEDNDNFAAIGLSHVVAVSGMHLAFLSGFLFFIFGKRKTSILIIPVLLLFTLVVGAPPSVVRALIMHSILILAPVLKGEADSVNSLSIALVFLLILNPYSIMDIGLQLSFLAALGIIVLGGRINNRIQRPFKSKNKFIKAIVRFFASAFSASIAAIIFTTPVIAWNFGTVSVIAPISNILLLWAVNVIFIASIFVVIFAFVYMPLAEVIVVPITYLAGYILDASGYIAEIPFSNVYIENIAHMVVLVFFYLALFLYVKDPERKVIVPLICFLAIVGLTVAVSGYSEVTEHHAGIRFAVLDVGQGSAMMADYNGSVVLVDCGGNRGKNAGDIALEHLSKIEDDTIDALVITHFDADHVNGVVRLIESGKISEIYLPSVQEKSDQEEVIVEAAKKKGTKLYYITKERHISKNGLDFTLYPTGWLSHL